MSYNGFNGAQFGLCCNRIWEGMAKEAEKTNHDAYEYIMQNQPVFKARVLKAYNLMSDTEKDLKSTSAN